MVQLPDRVNRFLVDKSYWNCTELRCSSHASYRVTELIISFNAIAELILTKGLDNFLVDHSILYFSFDRH
jgi:hypothetical protein